MKLRMRKNQMTWRIGGVQGSGVDKGASMFAEACAYGGLHLHGQREYYSNIMGKHSYYTLRIDETPVRSVTDPVALLATFDAETVFQHALDVVPGGGIVFNPKLSGTPLSRLVSMEQRARDDLKTYLTARNLGETLEDVVREAGTRGVLPFPVPYEEILQSLAGERGVSLGSLRRLENTMAVASSLALLKFPMKFLERAVADLFKGNEEIIDLNIRACDLVYEYIARNFERELFVSLAPVQVDESRIYVTGNQAVALGKILAGCSFQTYYPISPATDESVFLESHEIFAQNSSTEFYPPRTSSHTQSPDRDRGSILVVQTEDEIAAIAMATGAALAGARASTSTSGPGFSLMVEGLTWAGINEVPVVVTLYQRGGPATGLPTRSEQGDLRFALHAGHGEFPRIILASGDLEETFFDATRAFNYAERYQVPVIHLLDKSMASSSMTCPVFGIDHVSIERGWLASEKDLVDSNGDFQPFAFTDSGISPRSVLGQESGISWRTGDEHDEQGHITEDPVIRSRMMEKRARKLETAAREIPLEEKLNYFGPPDAGTVILSWGSPKGAILDAMEYLEPGGHQLGFLQVRLLWPFPAQEIAEFLKHAGCRVAVENNFSGQFAGLVREHTGIEMDHLIVKYNGRPMSVDEIHDSLESILAGRAPGKVVLTHGA